LGKCIRAQAVLVGARDSPFPLSKRVIQILYINDKGNNHVRHARAFVAQERPSDISTTYEKIRCAFAR
jgi:hypothetical protein